MEEEETVVGPSGAPVPAVGVGHFRPVTVRSHTEALEKVHGGADRPSVQLEPPPMPE